MVVNLARISPRFADHGSKSAPTASSSFSFFFLPTSCRTSNHIINQLRVHVQLCPLCRGLTPVEPLRGTVGVSLTVAANMDKGSVPSSIELRGSGAAEEEEDEEEEVLPLRTPRRVFVSVT